MSRRIRDPRGRQGYNLGARYLVFLIITLGMFAYLLTGVFRLQVVESEEYADSAESRRTTTITLRGSLSASDNEWAGMLYNGKEAFFSPNYRVHIVDRVGGGDSFGGGLIYSLISGYSDQDAINFAVAASCLKHAIEHDFNLVSVQEVASLAGGNASGRVQR